MTTTYYTLKVYGPNTGGRFGPADIYRVADPSSIIDLDGVLNFRTPPTPATDSTEHLGRTYPGAPATNGSLVTYARGQWTKTVLTEKIEEDPS